jgi:hypothetical protein
MVSTRKIAALVSGLSTGWGTADPVTQERLAARLLPGTGRMTVKDDGKG